MHRDAEQTASRDRRRRPRPAGARIADRTGRGRGTGAPATSPAAWLRRPLTSLHLVLGVFGLLTLFGLVMVLSASAVESYTADGSSLLGVHPAADVLRARAGAVLARACGSRRGGCGRWPRPLLLVGVRAAGRRADRRARTCATGPGPGSRSGSFSLQPSEAVKVALTLWGAHVLVARRAVMHRWKHALSPVVPVTAAAASRCWCCSPTSA